MFSNLNYPKIKYLFIYSFKQVNIKFSNYFLYQLGYILEFFVTVYIWVYNNPNNTDLITYLFFGYILQRLMWTNVLNFLSVNIFSGKIVNRLLLPINLTSFLLIREAGTRIIMNLTSSGLMFLFLPLFIGHLASPVWYFWLFLPFILIIGFLIDFFISISFACLVFWLKEGFDPIYNFFTLGSKVLTGIYIPFNYLPSSLSQLMTYNPYSLLVYHPMQIYSGHYSIMQSAIVIFSGIIWVIVLYLISQLMLKLGLKEFESSGL